MWRSNICIYHMMTDDENIKLLLYTNVITFILWVASEILGMSKCEYNGVIHIIINGFGCMKSKQIEMDIHVRPREEEPLLNSVQS